MTIEDKILQASFLYQEFKDDKEAALAKYGQMQEVKVTGRVKVAVKDEYIVLDSAVRCLFDRKFYPKNIKRGQRVVITGFVTGFEVHVDMEHCAVI